MASFFEYNLDYILFIYGLTLIILAMVCFSVREPESRRMPWLWLGLFGLAHGAHELVEIFDVIIAETVYYAAAMNGLLALSFTFLLEFGLRGEGWVKGNMPRLRVYVPLMLLSVLGGYFGWPGLNAAIRYSLGLTGGLLASYALLKASGRGKGLPIHKDLALAGIFMAIYAVSTGLIVPSAPFFPASVINKSAFISLTGFPVQLARAGLALLVTLSVMSYARTLHMADVEIRGEEGTRRGRVLWPVMALLGVLVVGYFATGWLGKKEQSEMTLNLRMRARTAAAAVDHEQVRRLSGTRRDMSSPAYRQIKEQLESVHTFNNDSRFVYLLGLRGDDKEVFLVDAEPQGSKDFSFPGDVYEDATPEDIKGYKAGLNSVNGPYTDSWGTWVTGYAPIIDPDNGKILAQFGMDIDAHHWQSRTQTSRLMGITITLIMSILTLVTFVAWRRNRESLIDRARQRLANEKTLRDLTNSLGEGLLVMDNKGALAFMNPEAEYLLGWREDELKGRDLHEAVHCRDADGRPHASTDCPSHKVLENGRAYRTDDDVFLRKDGTKLPVAFVTSPIREGGAVAGAVVSFKDITERKQAEEALRKKSYDLNERVKELRCIYRFSGVFERTSLSIDKMLQEAVESLPSGWQYPEIACARIRLDGSEFKTSNFKDTWWKISRSFDMGCGEEGRVDVCYLEEMPLCDEGPFLKEEASLLDNIVQRLARAVERIRTTEMVKESEAKFRNLVEGSLYGVYIIQDGRFIYVNPRMVDISGYEADELTGAKSVLEFVYPEDRDIVKENIRRRISGEVESVHYPVRWLRKDGQVIQIEVMGSRTEYGGRPAIIGTLIDVTERKRADEALLYHKVLLESLNEASIDGVLVVNNEAVIVHSNRRFAEMWGIPEQIIEHRVDDAVLRTVLAKVVDPRGFAKRVRYLYAHPDESSRDEICLKDGRTFDRYSSTVADGNGVNYGRVWYFRDITERKRAEEALKESESKFRGLVESALIGVYILQEGKIRYANPRLAEIFGYPLEEFMGQDVEAMMHPDDRKDGEEKMRAVMARKKDGAQYRFRATARDGRPLVIEVFGSRTIYGGGPALLGTLIDVTEQVRAEEAVRENERRFRDILESVQLVALMMDTEGRTVFCNDFLLTISGWAREEVFGKGAIELFIPEDYRDELKKVFQGAITGEFYPHHMEIPMLTRRGEKRFISLNIALQRDTLNQIAGVTCIGEDITERKWAEEMLKEQEQRLKHMAHHDVLTGLPNRTLFSDRLNMALAHAHREGGTVAVMIIDLDRFKAINDTLGHAAGDKLLKGISERLSGCLRECDTVARIGGDEFSVVLPEITGVQDAEAAAQRIMGALMEPFTLEGREVYATVSIGIAFYPVDGADAVTLMKHADTALYRVKEQGRNSFLAFTPDMGVQATELMDMENSLRRAIEDEDFILYYQPQVDLATGLMVAMEALIRWSDGDGEFISPSRFIPVAEETGLMGSIGDWVLREACGQAGAWQDAGFKSVPVSVNMSARQFLQPGLVDKVAKAIADSGLAPEMLDVEVTEDAVMKDLEHAQDTIARLREMGVRVSVDNFGTGFSSIGCIKRLPLYALKVDMSFIGSITTDPSSADVTEAIIAMAHGLKLRVVAQGVETIEQLEKLRTLGCDAAQGYLFSKPLTVDEATGLLSRDGELAA